MTWVARALELDETRGLMRAVVDTQTHQILGFACLGYEGGEVETRGTWQNATLKTVQTEAASDYVTFNVHQWDKSNMEFYYGQTSANSDPNVYSVAESSTAAVQRALLIVIVDGDVKIGFHAPKADIRREDSIELAVDEFAYMPLRATIVKSSTAPYLFSWINVNAPEAPTP